MENNNQYVQPTYQAPQAPQAPQQPYPQAPQQPYPQQPYYPVPKGPSLIDKIYGENKTELGKWLKLISLLLFVLAPVALLLGLIFGIINAIDFESFKTFLSEFISGVRNAAEYLFMGGVLAAMKKRVDK